MATEPLETDLAGWLSFSESVRIACPIRVLMILALVTRHAGLLVVALAWRLVAFRLPHAHVHATSDGVMSRGPPLGGPSFVLAIMRILYIIEMLKSRWG